MAEKLYTLTEVSKRTGISLPTLQRYKKNYQSRIPSQGKGRKQRYPEEALAVFLELKEENLKKRGRPKKAAAKKKTKRRAKKRTTRATKGKRKTTKKRGAKKKAARKATRKTAGKKRAAARGDLLTLTEIGRRTGISYPTLLRYVKLYSNRIPHVGTGRKRRFPESAVSVFQELRRSSRRGRRKKTATRRGAAAGGGQMASRIGRLEREQREMRRELKAVLAQLKKPLRVTVKR